MNDIYLIYGSNYSLIKREIEKITKGYDDVVKYDLSVCKVDELLDDASCISMFATKKVLIGENALFLTTNINNINHNLDYLMNYINDENHSNIIVLTVVNEKLDERKKIVKLIKQKAKVINKETIEDNNLVNFVINEFESSGYKIDYKTANYFIDYVGKNVDILLSEIEKMIIYKENDKNILVQDINDITSKGFKDNIFDLTDGIMKKDYKKVYECYNDLITIGEEPIKIISLLANQFLLMYQVKLLSYSSRNNNEIAEILNVHPYRVKLAMQTNYLTDELSDILKKLHALDFDIKSGKVNKMIGLENFLLHL